MKKEEVEIFSDASNVAVMRHPGRSFPGSLIQGDSLCSLVNIAKRVEKQIDKSNLSEAKEELEELIGLLEGRLNHYEAVLKEHGIELPYVRSIT
ncbi:MAG: hypothetical protein JAZ17_00245 [Candidatus Thiodiazotropha endolucinida]|nr:hypothetical protein [Candidatus Thiodiazotropha endolucinida]